MKSWVQVGTSLENVNSENSSVIHRRVNSFLLSKILQFKVNVKKVSQITYQRAWSALISEMRKSYLAGESRTEHFDSVCFREEASCCRRWRSGALWQWCCWPWGWHLRGHREREMRFEPKPQDRHQALWSKVTDESCGFCVNSVDTGWCGPGGSRLAGS